MSTGRRRRLRLGIAAAIAALAAVVAVETTEPLRGEAEVLGNAQDKGPVTDAGCDVDGVEVTYDAAYSASPGAAGYRVVTATVDGVAPTCAGATVSVRLTSGATTLATGVATAGGSTVAVPFTAPPAAGEVDGVHVEIAGGTIPIPARCGAMKLDRFHVLTSGNDTFAGSKDRDLVYGLGGDDTIRGDNQGDCLVGQAGSDTLEGGNHDDVLLGGDGDDVLRGGSGDDVLDGGPGNDRCEGGPGKNTYFDCEVIVR